MAGLGRGRVGRLAVLAVALLCAAAPTPAWAAGGDLDPSWGGDGKVFTSVYGYFSYSNDVAIQPDGRIVAVGFTGRRESFAIVRYLPGGRRDLTFGDRGRLMTNFSRGSDSAEGVAIQGNGKIVVAGGAGGRLNDFAVARYLPAGRLDPAFSGNGKATTDFWPRGPDGAAATALQSDGRIVVAGRACGNSRCMFALARYRRDGTLDPTFEGDGKVRTSFVGGAAASDVAIQPDGRIVVAGMSDDRFALARYEADGTLDDSFGGDGRVKFGFGVAFQGARGVAIQDDGAIVVAGHASDFTSPSVAEAVGFAVARLDVNGAFDPSFGGGTGKVLTPFAGYAGSASDVAIQDDGRIVAVGSGGPDPAWFAVARYLTDGSLDGSFGGDGMVNTCACGFYPVANAVAIQANGRIMAAGQADTFNIDSQFVVVRYLAD